MATSYVVRRRFTPGELFARARAAEAATGIGRRRILCSEALFRFCDNMPYSMVPCSSPVVCDR